MTPNVHLISKYFFVKITFECEFFHFTYLPIIKILQIIHQNEALGIPNPMV